MLNELEPTPISLQEDQEIDKLSTKKGDSLSKQTEYKVFPYRWAVITVFASLYFCSGLQGSRYLALVPEFAEFYDTTNEFNPPNELGIDFLTVLGNILSLFFYPLSGYFVSKYGLNIMVLGGLLSAANSWLFYFAKDNFNIIIVTKVFSSLCHTMIVCCTLRVVAHWFPPVERPIAIAIGAIVGVLGNGASLMLGVFFTTGEDIIDITLKSCKEDFIIQFEISNFTFDEKSGGYLCTEEAEEQFCCFAETDIEFMNLVLAILVSFVGFLGVIIIREKPSIKPGPTANIKNSISFPKAIKTMFSHSNYATLCFADFLIAGPVNLAFVTVSRIVPPSVSDYAVIAAGLSIIIAIPLSYILGKKLGKQKNFYEFTLAGYSLGASCWLLCTICLFFDIYFFDILFLIGVAIALDAYLIWQISVYELKVEYVYDHNIALQGHIVGIDRTLINMASLTFVSTIPPERYEGDLFTGRQFSFFIGSFAMVIPVYLVWRIKGKRDYKRQAYEISHRSSI
eukprot:snap_masked-scaffold_43-processed-gene-1.102-mRNA-1 protein AED:1.00 eAED:1.00 QI:0/0/0/0/1/1/2/0/509